MLWAGAISLPLLPPAASNRSLVQTPSSAPAASGQYRKGAPSAFGVMRYKGANSPALPPAAHMQPQEANARKWSVADTMKVGFFGGGSGDGIEPG